MGAVKNTLQAFATNWAGQLTSLAKSYAPNHLKSYISSKTEELGEGKYSITLTVNMKANPQPNYGSLDARAQEFGSGLKSKQGGGTINIDAKNSPFLVFMGTNAYEGHIIKVKHVNHPGIQAANGGQGYLSPAMLELRNRGMEQLKPQIRDAILSEIRASFGKGT